MVCYLAQVLYKLFLFLPLIMNLHKKNRWNELFDSLITSWHYLEILDLPHGEIIMDCYFACAIVCIHIWMNTYMYMRTCFNLFYGRASQDTTIYRSSIFVILWLTPLWQHNYICAMLQRISLRFYTCSDNYAFQLSYYTTEWVKYRYVWQLKASLKSLKN